MPFLLFTGWQNKYIDDIVLYYSSILIIGEAYLRKKHNIGKEYKYYNTEGKNHLFIFKDGMMAYKQTFDLEGNKIANEY